jgi:hypothetical protein
MRRCRIDPWSGEVGFVVDRMALGQVFDVYLDFLSDHSISYSTPLIHNQGLIKQANSGLRTERT